MTSKEKEKKAKEAWLKALGAHIRETRVKQGLSGVDLSYQLDTDKANITRLEKGRINPTAYFIKQFCDVCEVSLDDFWKTFKE